MKKLRVLLMIVMTAPFAAFPDSSLTDWPQWRGPRQDGISTETGLLAKWPEEGPPELWRVKLGAGFSSVAAVGDLAYTMYCDEEGEYVVCINAVDGEIVWKVASDGLFENSYGDGPRATPTVHEGRVYTIGAMGAILCLDALSGEKIWGLNAVTEFEGEVPEYGFSASPVVLDEKLIVVVNGGEGDSLAALDRNTGDVIWTSLNDQAGYSTPLVIDVDNNQLLAVLTGKSFVVVAADDGRELWRHPWETTMDANVAMPIFHNNRLFISTGYDTGCALFEIHMKDGEAEVEMLWESKKMKNYFSSSILIDGYLYGFHNTVFTCMEFETGEVTWNQRGFNKGSLLAADGRLIVLGERAELALVEASPEAYTEVSRAEVLDGRTWVVPTVSKGRLFLRSQEELVCLDLNP